MTDAEELEIYKKYKESVPRQKQIMQEMEEDLQEAKAILIDIEQELSDGNVTQFVSFFNPVSYTHLTLPTTMLV